nr:MAG TPA: hypothetical protein [Inoviridae sp.]
MQEGVFRRRGRTGLCVRFLAARCKRRCCHVVIHGALLVNDLDR